MDIKNFLEENGTMGYVPVTTPMSSRAELYSDERLLTPDEAQWAQSIMGSLQYYSTQTRPDITATTNLIAQKLSAPTNGMKKPLKPIPVFKQMPGERKKQFYHRMNQTVQVILSIYVA